MELNRLMLQNRKMKIKSDGDINAVEVERTKYNKRDLFFKYNNREFSSFFFFLTKGINNRDLFDLFLVPRKLHLLAWHV